MVFANGASAQLRLRNLARGASRPPWFGTTLCAIRVSCMYHHIRAAGATRNNADGRGTAHCVRERTGTTRCSAPRAVRYRVRVVRRLSCARNLYVAIPAEPAVHCAQDTPGTRRAWDMNRPCVVVRTDEWMCRLDECARGHTFARGRRAVVLLAPVPWKAVRTRGVERARFELGRRQGLCRTARLCASCDTMMARRRSVHCVLRCLVARLGVQKGKLPRSRGPRFSSCTNSCGRKVLPPGERSRRSHAPHARVLNPFVTCNRRPGVSTRLCALRLTACDGRACHRPVGL